MAGLADEVIGVPGRSGMTSRASSSVFFEFSIIKITTCWDGSSRPDIALFVQTTAAGRIGDVEDRLHGSFAAGRCRRRGKPSHALPEDLPHLGDQPVFR
jgi:hypothetical protein